MAKLIDTIPSELLAAKRDILAKEAGFGAGPSCIAGEVKRFNPAVPLDRALHWLERYQEAMRAGHVLLEDNTLLWFRRDGFNRVEIWTKGENGPRPGVSIEM